MCNVQSYVNLSCEELQRLINEGIFLRECGSLRFETGKRIADSAN